MESSAPARVLVVAHKTAATPALLEAVRERAARGLATFTLLVPNAAHGLEAIMDPEDHDASEAQQVVELAVPLLEGAAGDDRDRARARGDAVLGGSRRRAAGAVAAEQVAQRALGRPERELVPRD